MVALRAAMGDGRQRPPRHGKEYVYFSATVDVEGALQLGYMGRRNRCRVLSDVEVR
jgi:hypothetical protein